MPRVSDPTDEDGVQRHSPESVDELSRTAEKYYGYVISEPSSFGLHAMECLLVVHYTTVTDG